MSATPAGYKNSPFPLIKGYSIGPDIAEGGFSRVYKAYNPEVPPPGFAAIKVISLVNRSSEPTLDEVAYKRIKKEIKVHKLLKHFNILELIDSVEDQEGVPSRGIPPAFYIVLAFASGGDLFDQLMPDVGLNNDMLLIHFYFRQLMAGLYFCHAKGIVHRDLKPENILLDGRGNLLLSDFGLCSVYKYNGKERMLTEVCGSAPYAAPELAFGRPYHGPAIDMWSSGIILFVLLVGNTPWDTPTMESLEFSDYVNGTIWQTDPWTRISPEAKSLLQELMNIDPELRLNMSQLLRNPWFKQKNRLMDRNGLAIQSRELAIRLAKTRGDLDPSTHINPDVNQICSELAQHDDPTDAKPDHEMTAMPRLSQEVARSQAANRFLQDTAAHPTQPFSCTVRLFTVNPILASQKTLHGNTPTMFISQTPIDQLVSVFKNALDQLGVEHKVKSLEDGVDEHQMVDYQCGVKFRISFVDNRKLKTMGSLRIEPIAEDEVADARDEEDAMDIDQKPLAEKTWGVVFKRQKGDVVEWRRKYEALFRWLPEGVVFAR